jgi:hypothetical protein
MPLKRYNQFHASAKGGALDVRRNAALRPEAMSRSPSPRHRQRLPMSLHLFNNTYDNPYQSYDWSNGYYSGTNCYGFVGTFIGKSGSVFSYDAP